jgi:hypothetical protein
MAAVYAEEDEEDDEVSRAAPLALGDSVALLLTGALAAVALQRVLALFHDAGEGETDDDGSSADTADDGDERSARARASGPPGRR